MAPWSSPRADVYGQLGARHPGSQGQSTHPMSDVWDFGPGTWESEDLCHTGKFNYGQDHLVYKVPREERGKSIERKDLGSSEKPQEWCSSWSSDITLIFKYLLEMPQLEPDAWGCFFSQLKSPDIIIPSCISLLRNKNTAGCVLLVYGNAIGLWSVSAGDVDGNKNQDSASAISLPTQTPKLRSLRSH